MVTNTIEAQKLEGTPFEEINKIEGEEAIKINHSDYIIDESKLAGGSAELLFFPKNEADVITIVNKSFLFGGTTPSIGRLLNDFGATEKQFADNNLVIHKL